MAEGEQEREAWPLEYEANASIGKDTYETIDDSGVTVLLDNEDRQSATVWNLNARHAVVTLP